MNTNSSFNILFQIKFKKIRMQVTKNSTDLNERFFAVLKNGDNLKCFKQAILLNYQYKVVSTFPTVR